MSFCLYKMHKFIILFQFKRQFLLLWTPFSCRLVIVLTSVLSCLWFLNFPKCGECYGIPNQSAQKQLEQHCIFSHFSCNLIVKFAVLSTDHHSQIRLRGISVYHNYNNDNSKFYAFLLQLFNHYLCIS